MSSNEAGIEVYDLNERDILDLKIKTRYCVSNEVHNAQVRSTVDRGYLPIAATQQVSYDPIAVVCSGPSLRESWEEIRKFKIVLTCSGAHDYLIERGIIPTYHMEADPREHKSQFTKHPHKDIQYLIASSCHKSVFDNLEGHSVRIWHTMGKEDRRHIPNVYPRGHWVLTGGCNVGLRALVVARVMGFTNIHIFGMDCCSDTKQFHVNAHPNEPKEKSLKIVKVGERDFYTTDVFLECARQFFKETSMLPDCRFLLHGDGLLQAIAIQKCKDPEAIKRMAQEQMDKKGKENTIAISPPEVISTEYARLNNELHRTNMLYGIGGSRYSDVVKKLKAKMAAESVLDYGCGKGTLADSLPFPIWEYDPAIPGKDRAPKPADLVICTDVLEHIEPNYLEPVLGDIARCTLKVAYMVINTTKSTKELSDGRNAHQIVENADWWKAKIEPHFNIPANGFIVKGPLVHVVASSKE